MGSALGLAPSLELLEALGRTELSPGTLHITNVADAICRVKTLGQPNGPGLAGEDPESSSRRCACSWRAAGGRKPAAAAGPQGPKILWRYGAIFSPTEYF